MSKEKKETELLPEGVYKQVVPEGKTPMNTIVILGDRFIWSVHKDGRTIYRIYSRAYKYRRSEGVLYLTNPTDKERCLCKLTNGSLWLAGIEFKMV